jgi:membrane associated rhomboid family serine protease
MMPIQLTRTIKQILIATLATFLIQQTGDQFLGTHLYPALALVPNDFLQQHYLWQLFTYSFVHSDVMHLFFNMLMLGFIGSELESLWGRRTFLTYYVVCTLFAGTTFVALSTLSASGFTALQPMTGASGPIYGLLLAYGIFFGERVMLFMMLFPLKAKHFVWVLILLELITTAYASGGRLAGISQLSAMLAGFVYLMIRAASKKRSRTGPLRANQARRVQKPKSKHLKLIVNNQNKPSSVAHEDDPKTWH